MAVTRKFSLLFTAVLGTVVVPACAPPQANDAPTQTRGCAHSNEKLNTGEILISDGWIRKPRDGARATAAFFTICNAGPEVALIGAEFQSAQAAELHETRTDNNAIASMRKLDQLLVGQNEELRLEPGGAHLMLIGLDAAGFAHAETKISLQFSDGQIVDADFEIRNGDQHSSGHHAH